MPDIVVFGRSYVIQPDAHPDTPSIRAELFRYVRATGLEPSPGNRAWLAATMRRAGLTIATLEDVRARKRASRNHGNTAA